MPRFSEAIRIGGSHSYAVGLSSIEFRFDERRHVNTVDHQILNCAADVDIDEVDAAHHRAAQINRLELRIREVNAPQLGAVHLDVLKARLS